MALYLWNVYLTFGSLLEDEVGQDLVEYALVIALIALAATAGIQSLAATISYFFTDILAGTLTYYMQHIP
jgi:pilus assembly protein Flp/PilA